MTTTTTLLSRSFTRPAKDGSTNRSFQGVLGPYIPPPSFSRERSFVQRSKQLVMQESTMRPTPRTANDDESFQETSFWMDFAEQVVQDTPEAFEVIVSPAVLAQARSIPLLDSSLNTVDALNISRATVQYEESEDEQQQDKDDSILIQAMEASTVATEHVQHHRYKEAQSSYEAAIRSYEQIYESNCVAQVNAAGCYRNLAVVARKRNKMAQALQYYKKAEALYCQSRKRVIKQAEAPVVTMDGELLMESQPESSLTEERTSLDTLLMETLHARAQLHLDYQGSVKLAIQCYEHCLKLLIHLEQLKYYEAPRDHQVRLDDVTFLPTDATDFMRLLIATLEPLGRLYKMILGHTTTTTDLNTDLFEDAVDILQDQLYEKDTPDLWYDAVYKALRSLSDVYFAQKELDRAIDALHDATSVKLLAPGKPSDEALEVMEKMGAANEKLGHWDKALGCYEQSLVAQSKYYGSTDLRVAKSLVNVARVTEQRDGPTEATSDLYKTANAIYAAQITTSDAHANVGKDVQSMLQLIPRVLRHGEYETAVTHLQACMARSEADGVSCDKAQIFFDLGRAYLGMKDYRMATKCLQEAIEEAGGDQAQVGPLMQQLTGQTVVPQEAEEEKTRDSPVQSMPDISMKLQDDVSAFLSENQQTERRNYRTHEEYDDDRPAKMTPSVMLLKEVGDDDKFELEPWDLSNPQVEVLYESFKNESSLVQRRELLTEEPVRETHESVGRRLREMLLCPVATKPNLGGKVKNARKKIGTILTNMRHKVHNKVRQVLQRNRERRLRKFQRGGTEQLVSPQDNSSVALWSMSDYSPSKPLEMSGLQVKLPKTIPEGDEDDEHSSSLASI